MSSRKNLTHTMMVRERIRASGIVDRLQAFVLGTHDPKTRKPVEMTNAQVTAALGVLRKVVPDLQAVEHSGHLEMRSAEDMSDEELLAIAAAGSTRTARPAMRQDEPPEVH